jgi:hypothetical protein
MAAPNLANPTTIIGKTTYLTLADTNETDLLVNSSSSGKALRVTNLMFVNIDGTAAVDGSATIYTAASGGTGHKIINTVTVPADSSIVVLNRENSVWLEEDRRITVQASAASDLAVICSYEEVA